MKNTNRQIRLDKIEEGLHRQCEPSQYNGHALEINKIHNGILCDLLTLPQEQHEPCIEDVVRVLALADKFCHNHPFNGVQGYTLTYSEFFPGLEFRLYQDKLSTCPFGWLESESLLKNLYHILVKYRRIQCQWNSFQKLFGTLNQVFHRVWWHGPLAELVNLMKNLIARHCMPVPEGGKIIKAIAQNFCNPKGEVLKPTSLSTLDTRGTSLSSQSFIDSIFDEVFNSKA